MELVQKTTEIKLTNNSGLDQLDWDNLPFGKVFSDHMFSMCYENGEWQQPKILPFQDIKMSPATSVLHYGQSCFEGMKANRNKAGEILLFRPYDNAKRFNASAERMCMPTIPEDVFVNQIKQLLDIDREWIPMLNDYSLYIRPFLFATDPYVGVKPSDSYEFIIFTCPVGAYYQDSVPVKIETEFTRAADGGTGYAKAAGNYAAALYPAKLAEKDGFQQLIWTDAKEHKYIEEAGTMNVMFVIGDTVLTPKSSDTILDGITRKSVVDIAKDWGMKVEERKIAVTEIIEAFEKGTIKEAFGAGTAATIAPIKSISFEGVNYELPEPNSDSFSTKVLSYIDSYKRGEVEDKFNWIEKI
jgi:branched-chain amino acid aminotransferase